MNEEKEDPILAAPSLVKDESTPMETETISNNVDASSDDKEKIRLTYDQRRLSLLSNPEYGVILAFLDKFRSNVDIQDYPWHLLEENLLSDQQNVSRRLIDFHLTLLKRISLGKGAHRDKFVSIITKFAYRFDFNDGDYLKDNGYAKAQIDIKLRILKNLLETQFDHNQAFKAALVEKPSFEIRSQAFGRDRSGAFYWLFLDTECFVRLFRENVDDERTWTSVATDKDELESFIKLLITDQVLRKKFPDWKVTHEPFNSFEPSNDFGERYVPVPVNIKQEDLKQDTPPPSPAAPRIKTEKKSVSKSKASASSSTPAPVIKNEVHSDQESTKSADKNEQRSRIASTEETTVTAPSQEINNNHKEEELKSPTKKSRSRRKSATWSKKKRRTTSSASKKDEQEQEVLPGKSPAKGRKRKQIIVDEEDIPLTKKNEETSQEKDKIPVVIDEDSNCNDLPIALRRSTRVRKPATNEPPSVTSSPAKVSSQTPLKKKLTNGKGKVSSQPTVKTSSQSAKSKGRRKGRRRAGKSSANGMSSSDDDHQPSEEDEEDEYNSDDYLPTKKQSDELDDDELFEEEEDDDDEFVPRRSAKTVAKRRGQLNDNNNEDLQSPSSACLVCAKTDRPESLLLCDDCDDAYHLECLKPVLLSVPEGDWYCPVCEQKRLSDKLVEKFIQLIKDYEELEVKRKQCMSKRTNRLANVMLNLDRMVKRSSKKRRTNGIAYSDEENEDEEDDNNDDDDNKSEPDEEDDDDDSVYGFKDDGSIDGAVKSKRSSASPRGRRDRRHDEEPEQLGVRSCRRKAQNYRFDDYNKKMKEAMLESGANDEDLDKDSDESEDDDGKKKSKSRPGYEQDDDFEQTSAKKDDEEFAPDENNSNGSDTEEEEEVYQDDDETSEEDDWRGRRRSSSKKKPTSKSNRRKSKNKSDDDDDDDDSLSDTELSNLQTANTTKSETNTDNDLNDTGNDDVRRSSRATTQRNYAKQQDGDSDEDVEDLFENGRPPPRRMRYKKRRGSDDSFVDDDDYEKLQRKRKIVKYGKVASRSSITDHLKNFVDEDQEGEEDKQSAATTQEGVKEDTNDASKAANKPATAEYNEPQPSDDDDFPDEQEIFKANGLLKLQKTLSAPKSVPLRPAFGAPTHSYQHAIVDPTARFAMIRPPVRPVLSNGYPSNGHEPNPGEDHQPSEVNGHNGSSS